MIIMVSSLESMLLEKRLNRNTGGCGFESWMAIMAATIHQAHDTMHISVLGLQYDTYLDTFKCYFTGNSTIELQRTAICICVLKLSIIEHITLKKTL